MIGGDRLGKIREIISLRVWLTKIGTATSARQSDVEDRCLLACDSRHKRAHLHGILLQHNSIAQKGSSCCERENKP